MKNLSIFIVLVVLFACQNSSTVSEEMKEYCACIHNPALEMSVCTELRNAIVRKYEFDPKTMEIIQNKLSECVKN